MSKLDELKGLIDYTYLPEHVAIIMDGNGRWAKERGMMRIFGHENGVKAVRETTEAAAEIGIKYLTLYAFSTENWARPQAEVDALMGLLVKTIHNELPTLQKNSIRLRAIGDTDSLPESCRQELQDAIEVTAQNTRLNLVLALNYSARWELTQAARQIATQVRSGILEPQAVNESMFASFLATRHLPDPELLIRTSGENRLSNFLLWQLAYAEFYFTSTYWPDFRKEDFYMAILEYQKRERRFGKTSEQVRK
jgi:undecaprenyl diphosphate synthase